MSRPTFVSGSCGGARWLRGKARSLAGLFRLEWKLEFYRDSSFGNSSPRMDGPIRHILFRLASVLAVLGSCAVLAETHETPKGGRDSNAAIEAHNRLDFGFPGFAELDARLSRDFLKFDNRANLRLAASYRRVAGPADGYLMGSWSPVYTLPIIPIHVILLADGKLLMWDSVGDNPTETYPQQTSTRAAIWDPENFDLQRVDNAGVTGTGYNVFCSGFAHLPDGTPFIAGGNRNVFLDGIDVTHFFDETSSSWVLGPTMQEGDRWYPSVTPLASGEMLITSGGPGTHEVLSNAGTLRSLTDARWYMDLYPWLQAAPNGKAFYFGPGNEMAYIDTVGAGSMTAVRSRDSLVRSYGSYAMYDIGKIVASGGGLSSSKTVAIDIRNPNIDPVVTQPADMSFGRRQHNLTALPDGTVLATGGNSSGATLIDMDANVFASELWDPATQTWRIAGSASEVRQYHSTAILLPDGRVFTGGGGLCSACVDVGYLQKNFEIFTPPYLYKKDGSGALADRPAIEAAPSVINYNETFPVATANPANIKSAVLMRVSSDTHSVNFEQRRVPLTFTATAAALSVNAPPNANVAPPGVYMLFLIDGDGVPSVARMVRVHFGAGIGAPLIVASTGGNSSATLSWIPVPGADGYTVRYGTTAGNYTNSVQAGNVTSISLNGLGQERYYFVITADAGSSIGGTSAEVSIQTNLAPTAAGVIVAGRVTSPLGYGLSRIRVTIDGGGLVEPRSTFTNPFGYYSFADITAGRSYLVSVTSNRVKFSEPTRLILVSDNFDNCNFASDPALFELPAPTKEDPGREP